MSCPWYEQRFVEDGEQLWLEGRPSTEFAAHARECVACTKLIRAESQLRPLLGELARSSRDAAPSATVRNVLLDQLRAHRPVRKPAFMARLAFAVVVLVCLAAIPAVWHFIKSRRLPAPETVKAIIPPPPSMETATQPPTQTASLRNPVRPPSTQAKLPASRDGFYPVVMCDSLSCDGPTVQVRVELPASPLAARGTSRRVVTDLLVGEDGLVRGVRVLQ